MSRSPYQKGISQQKSFSCQRPIPTLREVCEGRRAWMWHNTPQNIISEKESLRFTSYTPELYKRDWVNSQKTFGHSQDRKSRGRGSSEVGQLPSGIVFRLLNVRVFDDGCSTRHWQKCMIKMKQFSTNLNFNSMYTKLPVHLLQNQLPNRPDSVRCPLPLESTIVGVCLRIKVGPI